MKVIRHRCLHYIPAVELRIERRSFLLIFGKNLKILYPAQEWGDFSFKIKNGGGDLEFFYERVRRGLILSRCFLFLRLNGLLTILNRKWNYQKREYFDR